MELVFGWGGGVIWSTYRYIISQKYKKEYVLKHNYQVSKSPQ